MEPVRRAALPQLTDRLSLGQRGLRVSPVCLGLVASPEIVVAAFEAGINFFFVSADMHWPVYEPLRKGLAALLTQGKVPREQVVVAGVSYLQQPEFCSAPFAELLSAMPELGRLDVLIAGGAYESDVSQRFPVFRGHRVREFVGAHAIGASFHDRRAALNAINDSAVDIAFVRYNANHPGAEHDLFPHLAAPRSTLVFNFTSTQGFVPPDRVTRAIGGDDVWCPTITDHYRLALSHSAVDGILCALGRVDDVAELHDALQRGVLSSAECEHLISLADFCVSAS